MKRARLSFAAAIAVLIVSGIPTSASAAVTTTGWTTSNALHNLAGCSVYSDWSSDHKTATATESVACAGSVRPGLKIGATTYVYGTWRGYQSSIVSSTAGSAHYSAYSS